MKQEKCKCEKNHPIVLQYDFSSLPFACANCNLDVDLGRLDIDDQWRKKVGQWMTKYRMAYLQWLDLDELPPELANPAGTLHELGFELVTHFNAQYPMYYWWHLDTAEQGNRCPKCQSDMMRVRNEYTGSHLVCNTCRLLVVIKS